MPPAYTQTQRAAIAQFVSFTSAKDSVAARQLKAHGWSVEAAVDSYFYSPAAPSKPTASSLHKLFDKYRDDPIESPDTIGTTGTMKYLTDLGVKLDEPAVLAILTDLSAPTMGELTRDGFVNGWKARGSADTLSKQQSYLSILRRQLSNDRDYFRQVYRHSFIIARTQGQKGVGLETAIDFWRLLFSKGGIEWRSNDTEWLELWVEYLETRWKRSVGKDMWDQTGVFATRCMDDGTMGWWSEDGAWPGVLDEFVEFVREKRMGGCGGSAEVGGEGEKMEIE